MSSVEALAVEACRVRLGLSPGPLQSPLEADLAPTLMALEAEGLHGLVADLWLPHTERPEVRQVVGLCRLRHQRLGRELHCLASASPCDLLVFKGAATGTYLYQAGQRDCRDMDVQVGPSDRTAFVGMLRSRGYQTEAAEGNSYQRGVLQVDLHEHPLGLAERLFPIPLDEIWAQSETLTGRMRRPSYEMEFVLGLVHSAKHGFGRMVWLLDSALLLQRLPASRVLPVVQRYGASRLLDYSLWAMVELFQMAPPPGLEQAIRPWGQRGLLERWLLTKIRQRRGTDRLGRLLLAFACPRPQARWWLLRSLLWPPGLRLGEQLRRLPRLLQLLYQGEL